MRGASIRSLLKSGSRSAVLVPLLVVVALLANGCGDTASTTVVEPESAATTPASSPAGESRTAPAPVSTDTPAESPGTSSPETTTTTPSGTARVGYQVVDVAADDVLNVRAGPSAREEIVGALSPDATGVVVTDTRSGGDWWAVVLDDGVEGWVNSRYLAIDDAWTAPFDVFPCAAAEAGWGKPHRSPPPAEPSDAAFVYGYDYLTSPQCDRLVIQLAARPDDATHTTWHASVAATTVPGGVEVTSGSNRVTVTFPGEWIDIRWGVTEADYGAAQLFAIAPIEAQSKLAVQLVHDSERVAHARFLDDPARVVVDVKPAAHATGVDYSPEVGRLWVLTEPVLWDGTVAGTQQPLTITGFGRPYEAWGFAGLTRLDGNGAEAEALWDGGIDCSSGAFLPGPARADSYCFTAPYHVWGEFSFTLDELPPGRYRLTIADECAADEEVDCDEFVMHHDFTVQAAQPVPEPIAGEQSSNASQWVGRIARRASSDVESWDRIEVDGHPTDLLVEIGGAVAPWSGDHSVVGKAWIVSGEAIDYGAPQDQAQLMVWLGEEIEPNVIEILDVLILDISETQPFEWCFQERPTEAAWPLVVWVGDSAWAASAPPELFTPFDPADINCSAG